MRNGHGGDIRTLEARAKAGREGFVDFSASINPLGPPEWLRDAVSANVSSLVHYPDPACAALIDAISKKYGCDKSEAIAGNGSSEIIYLLPRAMDAKRAVIPVPAYMDYEAAALAAGLQVRKIAMPEEGGFAPDVDLISREVQPGDLVFIGHPVNPSGTMIGATAVRRLAAAHPGAYFAVDEAFLDFVEDAESLAVNRPANVVALVSFTKVFAIPGLRLGAAIADAKVIERLREIQPGWSVNSLAQAVGERALADVEYVERTKAAVAELRQGLFEGLSSIKGIKVYPARANYLLARLGDGSPDAAALAEKLLDEGIAIRVCGNFDGLGGRYFRVAVRPEEENARLLEAINGALGVKSAAVHIKKKTPAVMFQATCSNAGKSVLAAGVCRIMLRDGYRVAPFKAQNMSLNSYVARDGGEMGRAQATQAQACRLDPETRMNPILLKPNSDTGSQVIVDGRPVGNMNVAEYIRYKPEAFARAKAAYQSLADEFDAIVLEGAGSPAEVNLKKHDIVNMPMALHAGAAVYIIGDIDRGGVFASFVGSLETMAEWERKLAAGFIINKFRGDESLLKDALDYTLARTGKPVIGTIPYITRLGLPEEDSVSFKRGDFDSARPEGEFVDIAVIDLPHISNFNDFDPLRIEPDVFVRTVDDVSQLGSPDAVIIPGSKNVIGDVEYLKRSGLGARILELAAGGTEIAGVCAGFQILGGEIFDPHKIESSSGKTAKGLGLLPVSNTLEKEKTLTRARAVHVKSGLGVYGYEIHHGVMDGRGAETVIRRDDGAVIGTGAGNAWGTYLHGIFDADEFRRWFIDGLRVKRGLSPIGKVCAVYDMEPALDRLADVVSEHLDMSEIYRAMGLK